MRGDALPPLPNEPTLSTARVSERMPPVLVFSRLLWIALKSCSSSLEPVASNFWGPLREIALTPPPSEPTLSTARVRRRIVSKSSIFRSGCFAPGSCFLIPYAGRRFAALPSEPTLSTARIRQRTSYSGSRFDCGIFLRDCSPFSALVVLTLLRLSFEAALRGRTASLAKRTHFKHSTGSINEPVANTTLRSSSSLPLLFLDMVLLQAQWVASAPIQTLPYLDMLLVRFRFPDSGIARGIRALLPGEPALRFYRCND